MVDWVPIEYNLILQAKHTRLRGPGRPARSTTHHKGRNSPLMINTGSNFILFSRPSLFDHFGLRLSFWHYSRYRRAPIRKSLLSKCRARGGMADTPDLGSGPARGGGSSPLARTTVVAWRDDEVMVMMRMTCIARTDLEVDAIVALWRHD